MTQIPNADCHPLPHSPSLDFDAFKAKQKGTWSSGDYSVIGITLQIVGETLCEAADVCAGERVLDVACGNGNATLAAARRYAKVTGLDYAPQLLSRAGMRARAEGLSVDLREGDAEAMPFDDGSFDVVLSTFGVMFAPNQVKAAAELARVCRPGGRIALASWTPEGFIGELLKLVGRYVPPPPGLLPVSLWGKPEHVTALFGDTVSQVDCVRREFAFRYASPAHFIDVFRAFYGPTHKAFLALDEDGRRSLHDDLEDLLRRWDRGSSGALVAPGEYLEVVAVRR